MEFADALEQELLRAARAQVARGRISTVSVWRRGLGLTPAFVSVLVALAVGFAAIALLREGQRVPKQSTGRSSSVLVQRVVAQYEVLRRPQTAADRLKPQLLPAHTLRSLVRRVATVAGHKVYLALALNHSRVTAWEITSEHNGVGQVSFSPFPLHDALPEGEQLGRQSVWLVPDSVTRALFSNYSGHLVARAAHHNIVSAPGIVSDGVAVYAGARQVAAVSVPVARIRLVRPAGSPPGDGQAFISRTTGEGLQVDVAASGVQVKSGTHLDLWLYRRQGRNRLLSSGVGPPYWPRNELIGTARLPQNYRAFSELLIASPGESRSRPGKIWFEGRIHR